MNVARKRRVPKMPFLRVLRRKPGGMFYALQYWRPGKRGPAELRFSRWTGDPTAVTLGSSVVGVTETIAGQAVFDGSGISGKTSTPGGTKKAIFVGLDCRGCPAGRGWMRIVSRKPQAPDGSFALRLKPRFEGNRYRVTIAGPNSGTQLAPDATATVASARRPNRNRAPWQSHPAPPVVSLTRPPGAVILAPWPPPRNPGTASWWFRRRAWPTKPNPPVS